MNIVTGTPQYICTCKKVETLGSEYAIKLFLLKLTESVLRHILFEMKYVCHKVKYIHKMYIEVNFIEVIILKQSPGVWLWRVIFLIKFII